MKWKRNVAFMNLLRKSFVIDCLKLKRKKKVPKKSLQKKLFQNTVSGFSMTVFLCPFQISYRDFTRRKIRHFLMCTEYKFSKTKAFPNLTTIKRQIISKSTANITLQLPVTCH